MALAEAVVQVATWWLRAAWEELMPTVPSVGGGESARRGASSTSTPSGWVYEPCVRRSQTAAGRSQALC
jgi:hypothetical protein